jgi:uncharacterized phage-associated protein
METPDETNRIKADISKLKAVILYIIKVSGGKMSIPYLFGQMYFSQKRYLVRYGKPLINDSFYANEIGSEPVVTSVAFHCAEGLLPYVADIIKRLGASFTIKGEKLKYVWAKEEPDMNELSAEEIRTIDRVVKKYGGLTYKQLVNEMRDDAWEKALERKADNHPQKGFLSLADIARAGGVSEEKIDNIRRKYEFNPYCRE